MPWVPDEPGDLDGRDRDPMAALGPLVPDALDASGTPLLTNWRRGPFGLLLVDLAGRGRRWLSRAAGAGVRSLWR